MEARPWGSLAEVTSPRGLCNRKSRAGSAAGKGLPSTRMRAAGPTTRAGLLSFLPSTMTRPAAIHASASRREQRPARAIRLAMRSPGAGLVPGAREPPSAGGGYEGIEDLFVANADGVFRMPLDTEAEAVTRVLDALDHAVGSQRVDDHARPHGLRRLVMGAVDLKL